jgi:hypothetical protein
MRIEREDTKQRKELLEWLAKRLRVEEIPPPLQIWLEKHDLMQQVLEPNDPLSRKDFLDLVKEYLQFATDMVPFLDADAATPVSSQRQKPPKRESERGRGIRHYEPPVFDPLLDPLAHRVAELFRKGFPMHNLPSRQASVVAELAERWAKHEAQSVVAQYDPIIQRAQAFSLYLAKLANEDPEVKQFRREVLGDEAFTSEEEAEALIYSPAAALFSSAWFKEYEVPLLGHTAQVVELKRLSSGWPRRVRGTVKIAWGGRELVSPFEGSVLSSDPFERGLVGSESISALMGSVISQLLQVDEHLRERFPWSPLHRDMLQVPMFVLRGRVPWVEPIRAALPQGSPDLYETVSITVWPWVPAEDVASLYERVRKELNPTPNTSSKRLAIFTFMMKRPEVKVPAEGERPIVRDWRKFMCSWNEQHPEGHEWHYKDVDEDGKPDPRNFRRDFVKAYDQIVNFYRSDTWWTKRQTESEERDLVFDFYSDGQNR